MMDIKQDMKTDTSDSYDEGDLLRVQSGDMKQARMDAVKEVSTSDSDDDKFILLSDAMKKEVQFSAGAVKEECTSDSDNKDPICNHEGKVSVDIVKEESTSDSDSDDDSFIQLRDSKEEEEQSSINFNIKQELKLETSEFKNEDVCLKRAMESFETSYSTGTEEKNATILQSCATLEDTCEQLPSESSSSDVNHSDGPCPDELVTCNICDKTLTLQESMRKHKCIPLSDKCRICNKSFKDVGTLKRHMRAHTNVRPYVCSFCEKPFTRSDNMFAHMRTHTNERPYMCSVCGKSFSCGSNLSKHSRSHSSERAFTCSVCGKSYTYAKSLKAHVVFSHTNERPHTCHVCNKSFSCSLNLKSHERTHLNVWPYKCSDCNKKFTHKSYLKIHRRTHAQTYMCSVCNKSFKFSSNLAKHECTDSNVQPIKNVILVTNYFQVMFN